MGKEQLAKKVRDFQVSRRKSKKRNLKALLKRIDRNRRILHDK